MRIKICREEKKILLINSKAIVHIHIRVSEPICYTKSISYINIHPYTCIQEAIRFPFFSIRVSLTNGKSERSKDGIPVGIIKMYFIIELIIQDISNPINLSIKGHQTFRIMVCLTLSCRKSHSYG